MIGGEPIQFDICPICFSDSRTRLLFQYIETETRIGSLPLPISVLHIAPEYGIFARLRAVKAVDYRAVDISPRDTATT